jgi:hypothetical protein
VASSFETPACGGLLRMRSETLMVRSTATPRVSNHVVVSDFILAQQLWHGFPPLLSFFVVRRGRNLIEGEAAV